MLTREQIALFFAFLLLAGGTGVLVYFLTRPNNNKSSIFGDGTNTSLPDDDGTNTGSADDDGTNTSSPDDDGTNTGSADDTGDGDYEPIDDGGQGPGQGPGSLGESSGLGSGTIVGIVLAVLAVIIIFGALYSTGGFGKLGGVFGFFWRSTKAGFEASYKKIDIYQDAKRVHSEQLEQLKNETNKVDFDRAKREITKNWKTYEKNFKKWYKGYKKELKDNENYTTAEHERKHDAPEYDKYYTY